MLADTKRCGTVPLESHPDLSDAPLPTTDGTLFDGTVRFTQPTVGYRAAIDGLLLAYFAASSKGKLAVDLGAGAGMVSLGLLKHERAQRLLAIEAHAPTAAVLARNFADNGWAERAQVSVGSVDVVARSFRGAADLVVANPPYFDRASGTAGADVHNERAVRADDPLGPFVRAARLLLGRGGRASFVFPARELEPLLARLASKDLHARRVAFVHPTHDEPASRVLLECSVGRAGGLVVEPSWALYESVDNGQRLTESAKLRAVSRAAQHPPSPASSVAIQG